MERKFRFFRAFRVRKKRNLCDFASLRLKYLLSPSKKTEKRPLYSQKLIKLKQVPNPFPVKGQGGGWRRKNNRDNAHTAIASCPFTGKDVRRTERGRF